jgi:hypothetical protein
MEIGSELKQDYYGLVGNKIACIEIVGNVCGYIPIMGTGSIRIGCGFVAVAYNIVKIIFSIFFQNNWETHKENIYIIHGVVNIFRGSVETIYLGNLAMLIYDLFLGRMTYPKERRNPFAA